MDLSSLSLLIPPPHLSPPYTTSKIKSVPKTCWTRSTLAKLAVMPQER